MCQYHLTKFARILFLIVTFLIFTDKQVSPCRTVTDASYLITGIRHLASSFLLCSIPLAEGAENITQTELDLEIDLEDIAGLEDEIALLAEEAAITIASKRKEKLSEAPSIVTVITAEEIENIGARTLFEILTTVPGFDIIKEGQFGRNLISARGFRGADEKIKVHIDGHSLNIPFDGGTSHFFDDLPLKNVKKIEVIRGPGSALYGNSAFLAVINIVTKDADDIEGIEVSSGFGSFDTQEYGILFGKTIYDVDIAGFADFYNTNGLSDTIKEDAFFGAPFSIAPGDTDDSENKLDLNLKLTYKDLKFITKYMNKDREAFVGSGFGLTNEGESFYNYVMGELSYKLDISERLTVKPRAYYDQYDFEFFNNPFPEGFTIQFPDGVLGSAIATNRRLGGEIQMDYELFDDNTFTMGFNYEWERQDNVTFSTNFDPLTNASLGSIQNVSDIGNWIREVNRQIWAIYIQDKWDITDDMGLTIGIRHDHYSDFEGTTNPRIGLVWDFMENATLKFLYGQAFRAPSFLELFIINNPVRQGNPDLDPETIRTYEVGLSYDFTKKFSANVNYFFNVIRDEISEAPVTPGQVPTFDNLGGSNIQGIEFELKADLGDIWEGSYAFANYTYQDSESKGDPLPDVPKHKGNVGLNVGLGKHLNANLHAFISDERVRAEADTRDDSPGYALINLTLIAKEFFKRMNIKASLFNLLDKDYNDPAPLNTIPTDLPRPGRTFFIELNYKY